MIPMKFVNGLIPVIVQDVKSRDVLMLAYATEQAVNLTRTTGFAHYFSRSRNKIWKKGEESGHFQRVVRILVDCDEDCLIYDVEQTGAACHTGYTSCFYRSLDGAIISERAFDPDKVYKERERKQ
jgi:phosphoribosyl-AMP cyclohydrolase